MKSRLLLNVVVRQSSTVFKLLTSENQTLLVRRNTLLILNLGLDIVNGIRRLHLKSNSFTSEGLDKDLHTTTETEDKMEGRLLLNVVIRQGSTVFQLLTSENQTLLVRRNTLLILNLGLDVINSVGGLNFEGNGFTSEGLDKDLHTTTETKDKMESRLFLNVVVRQGSTVFKLLTSENQTLLVRRDTLLILNLGLDVINSVGRLNFECDGLTGESLNKDLHDGVTYEDSRGEMD